MLSGVTVAIPKGKTRSGVATTPHGDVATAGGNSVRVSNSSCSEINIALAVGIAIGPVGHVTTAGGDINASSLGNVASGFE